MWYQSLPHYRVHCLAGNSAAPFTNYLLGLCSGVQAAKLLGCQPRVEILSVEADEAHIQVAKSTVKQGRQILPQLPYSA